MVTLHSLFFFYPCGLEVAQSDAALDLTWGSSSEVREVQGRLRSPPRAVSPHRHVSPTRTSSPASLDPALQAVQAAIERRQQREQVCGHSPQGHQSHRSCPAGMPLWNFPQPALAGRGLPWSRGQGRGVGGQVSMESAPELHSLERGFRCQSFLSGGIGVLWMAADAHCGFHYPGRSCV